VDCLLVGLIQGFLSYPFFDPIMMDRSFLSTPETMIKAFYAAGLLSIVYILFFGVLGCYAKAVGFGNDPTLVYDVSQSLGISFFCVVDAVMITSSLAAIDSCLCSTARVIALDMFTFFRINFPYIFKKLLQLSGSKQEADGFAKLQSFHLILGRVSVVLMAFCGNLPLISEAKALDATTVSGTVVMGMGPPIILMVFWKPSWGIQPMTFIGPWVAGTVLGAMMQSKVPGSNPPTMMLDNTFSIGDGDSKVLLGVNVYGQLICIALLLGSFVCYWIYHKAVKREVSQVDAET